MVRRLTSFCNLYWVFPFEGGVVAAAATAAAPQVVVVFVVLFSMLLFLFLSQKTVVFGYEVGFLHGFPCSCCVVKPVTDGKLTNQ